MESGPSSRHAFLPWPATVWLASRHHCTVSRPLFSQGAVRRGSARQSSGSRSAARHDRAAARTGCPFHRAGHRRWRSRAPAYHGGFARTAGVQASLQFLDRGTDQAFVAGADDARVARIGLEKQHFVDREQLDAAAQRGADPADPLGLGTGANDGRRRPFSVMNAFPANVVSEEIRSGRI